MSFGRLGSLGRGYGRMGGGGIVANDPLAPDAPVLTWDTGQTDNTPTFTAIFDDTLVHASGDIDVSNYDDIILQWDTDSSFGSVDSDTNTLDAAELLAGEVAFTTGALADGTWYARVRHNHVVAGVDHFSPWSNTVTQTIDTTAPTLSSPTGAETGTTTADISVSTDEANGTLYYVVDQNTSTPSAAQVKAGQDQGGAAADKSGSVAVSATGVKSWNLTGLTLGTTYKPYFMHEDAAGNQSAVATTTAFTTDGASYTADAVTFDGTNDYLTRGAALSGSPAASKLVTISFWVRINAVGTQHIFVGLNTVGGGSGTQRLVISRNGSAALEINIPNQFGTARLNVSSSTTFGSSSAWQHVLFSCDLADTAKRHLYLTDVSDLATVTSYVDNTMYFQHVDWSVGALADGTSKLNGDLADFLFWNGVYTDLSVVANRRMFIDGSGKPVDPATPIATLGTPLVHLAGPTVDWHTNQGSGGGFTENGALTDAGSSPSD